MSGAQPTSDARYACGGPVSMNLRWSAGLLSGIAGLIPGLRQQIEAQLETEAAAWRLAALAFPALPTALAEVKRRETIMTKLAALQSVADDVATGRWMP